MKPGAAAGTAGTGRARGLLLALLGGLAWVAGAGGAPRADAEGGRGAARADPGCLSCHEGVEEMHPWEPLSCTDCHGGDGAAEEKERAHVAPKQPVPNDERTVPLAYDLAYRRFANPNDLRVVDQTCGRCHRELCANLEKSLHGTTAGHLSDGLYENGVTTSKAQRYAIFPVKDEDGKVPEKAYRSLAQIPAATPDPAGPIGGHFADLPRKSCMQCHLYSRGVGVRGRLGMDGWYRGDGCSACHVHYADDGLSKSKDPTIDKLEPGHPRTHEMTRAIPTEICTRCHALDANIGMSFRGLAQLPPGVPGGPDVPGTTKRRIQGQFFLEDPSICPADVHHARGMHCVDCHNVTDAMGDGNIYGEMEYAVGVSCQTCHGGFDAKADFRTTRGETLEHLRWEGETAILRGKVDGKDRVVKQARDVVTPGRPHYNEKAARAMTGTHGRLECYACHSAWSVNFFGFHFDRNESFTQLDILSGRRTPGRATTNEKIFATFRHYYLGWNSEGRIAPYMVGFSTTGTFRDGTGRTVLRQEMPVTAAGLSGMTLIHHQLHTVQPAARRCLECHAAPSVLGLGSENFRLFRDLVVAVGDAGLTVAAFDGKSPEKSKALANLPLPARPLHVALATDPMTGRARAAYVCCRDGNVHVVDLSDPVDPRLVGELALKDARRSEVREGYLFVAAGREGLAIASLQDPKKPRLLSIARTQEARALRVDGIYAYVADGPAGLRVVDVSVPAKPAVTSSVDLNGDSTLPLDANDVVVHFFGGRPDVAGNRRSLPRNVAFVADGQAGFYAVDVTRPERPEPIPTFGRTGFPGTLSAVALAFTSNYDIGSAGGDIPSAEREYLFVVGTDARSSNGLLVKLDVSAPDAPAVVGTRRTVSDPRGLGIAPVYQAPFLKLFAVVAGRGQGDVEIVDVTARLPELPAVGPIEGVGPAVSLDLERAPLDRLVGFDGKPLKDVSHEGARLFTREEIIRILRAEVK